MQIKIYSLIAFGLFFGILLPGCSSNSSNPVMSDTALSENPTLDQPQTPSGNSVPSAGRFLWGIWNLSFDPATTEVMVEPAREGSAHFDITAMLIPPQCGDCVKVEVTDFYPVSGTLYADITLRNPTAFDGYDVRGILYTNDVGHELRNPDAWTKRFDIPGGSSLNPFIAFADDIDHRKFAAFASHTREYRIDVPSPPQYDVITFAVSVSYPDNCLEPYAIDNFDQGYFYEFQDCETEIQVDVFDWQNDVDKVTLVAPEITGEEFTQFHHHWGNIWKLTLVNKMAVPPGFYKVRIIASSANSGAVALYDYVNIYVHTWEGSLHPMEMFVPQIMISSPFIIEVHGDYAYIDSNGGGLHIYDVSDPAMPQWVNWLKLGKYNPNFTINEGYAFVGCTDGLLVVDVDPPEQAHITHVIDPDESAYVFKIRGNYLYTVWGNLNVIDITSPENAAIVSTMDLPGAGYDLAFIDENHAYITDSEAGILLVDISDPLNPFIVDTIETSILPKCLTPKDGLVYCVVDSCYFYVLDLDPFDQPKIVANCKLWGNCSMLYSLEIIGEYAFVSTKYDGLEIINISNPLAPTVVRKVDIPGNCGRAWFKDGLAFVTDAFDAITVVDIDPPLESKIIGNALNCRHIDDIKFVDDIAYTSARPGLRVFKCESFEDIEYLKSVNLPIKPNSVENREIIVSDGYVYRMSADGFNIINADPYSSEGLIKTIEIADDVSVFDVSDGAACLYNDGIFYIIDVSDPATASIVKEIDTYWYDDIVIHNGYAYAMASDLFIIDIDPLIDSHIVNTVDLGNGSSLGELYNGNLVVVNNAYMNKKLFLFDISSPESPSVINSFGFGAYDIEITNEYIYSLYGSTYDDIRIYENGLPDSLNSLGGFDLKLTQRYITVHDNFLWATGSGLEIYMIG